jgi:hypothetical protein
MVYSTVLICVPSRSKEQRSHKGTLKISLELEAKSETAIFFCWSCEVESWLMNCALTAKYTTPVETIRARVGHAYVWFVSCAFRKSGRPRSPPELQKRSVSRSFPARWTIRGRNHIWGISRPTVRINSQSYELKKCKTVRPFIMWFLTLSHYQV